MTIGPLELAVIGYERPQFQGEIASELVRLRDTGMIRIVDLVFAAKDAHGAIVTTELAQADDTCRLHYGDLAADVRGVLTGEDVTNVALELPNDSAAVIVLFEQTWSVALEEAVRRAGGQTLGQVRISPAVVAELEAELEAALAG